MQLVGWHGYGIEPGSYQPIFAKYVCYYSNLYIFQFSHLILQTNTMPLHEVGTARERQYERYQEEVIPIKSIFIYHNQTYV